MSKTKAADAPLYAEDIARLRVPRISVRQARTQLAQLEARYGQRVVGRDGRRRYTTQAALAGILPDNARGLPLLVERVDHAEDEIASLSRQLAEHAKRLDAVERRVERK